MFGGFMGRKILLVVSTAVLLLSALVNIRGFSLGESQMTDLSDLPEKKQGSYPIHMPDYDGIDQLLLLSDSWIVACFSNVQEVVNKIDELTDGEYRPAVETWEASKQNPKPNWTIYRNYIEPTRDKYLAEARELAGERNYDNPNYFTISSQEDDDYKDPQTAQASTRFINSMGGEVVPGALEIHWAHYCFLNLPKPLKNGMTYELITGDGKKVSFLYDELRTISRAIKVNQHGYLANAPKKFAYLAAHLHELGPLDFSNIDEFLVIDVNSGTPVLTGQPKLRAANPRCTELGNKDPSRPLYSGEDIYELDLSDLKTEGEYFISIPKVGRSWTFTVSDDVFGDAFYIAARGLYHQRCGIEIGAPYSNWPRIKCHQDPIYESDHIAAYQLIDLPKGYNLFDVIGATTDSSTSTSAPSYGWHDAADWDKRVPHYSNIFDLLCVYELQPKKYRDSQLNIPESGNGIPDILDEALYGLKVWQKSIKDGGAAGAVETWTHPPIDADVKYSFSKRDRWCSLLYAAAASQMSRLIERYDSSLASQLLSEAQETYTFGMDTENSLNGFVIKAKKNRGSGDPYTLTFEEKEEALAPYKVHAKLQLYLTTEDDTYLEELTELLKKCPPPFKWPYDTKDTSPWTTIGLFHGKMDNKIDPILRDQWIAKYLELPNELLNHYTTNPYRASWPLKQDWWMAFGNTSMTNQARALLIAHGLTGDDKYKEAALFNIDFMLGANPLGISWTTGLGFTYPIDIQHDVSQHDGIKDPVPGIQIFGYSGGYPKQISSQIFDSKKEDGTTVSFIPESNRTLPVWKQWAAHPYLNVNQNEFTIYETMSGQIFSFAYLLGDNYKPSQDLKDKKPRKDDLLFGYWYLP